MRIAQVPPLYEAVPPRFYGGTERVVAHLTDALVHLGHQVTLFASAEAQTNAQLVKVRDQAIRLDPVQLKSDLAAHMSMLWDVRRRADEFDIIHLHTDMIHFPFFEDVAKKTLTTLHGRLDLKDLPGVYWRWQQFPWSRSRTPSASRWPSPTGPAPCITACRRTSTSPDTARAITSPSSGGSRRRSAPTGRSPWPGGPACR